MMLQVNIEPISPDTVSIAALRNEAAREGFSFLERLARDWSAGTNRFQKPGEKLVGAFAGEDVVGVAGLNLEPYELTPSRARLRHLYVSPACRRRGVASSLVRQLLKEAHGLFDEVRLRTDSADAAAFYEALGFNSIRADTAT